MHGLPTAKFSRCQSYTKISIKSCPFTSPQSIPIYRTSQPAPSGSLSRWTFVFNSTFATLLGIFCRETINKARRKCRNSAIFYSQDVGEISCGKKKTHLAFSALRCCGLCCSFVKQFNNTQPSRECYCYAAAHQHLSFPSWNWITTFLCLEIFLQYSFAACCVCFQVLLLKNSFLQYLLNT